MRLSGPPATTRPLAASVNYSPGSVDANAVLVGLGGGDLCVYSLAGVDVVVDITGVFVGSTRAFEPLTPSRILDTREIGQRLARGGSLSFAVTGVAGILIAARVNSAQPALGQGYELEAIAAVVIGGTSVAGGRASVPGIWGAALFMYLLVTMLNTFGASAGVRLIMTGTIIIAVIILAGGETQSK